MKTFINSISVILLLSFSHNCLSQNPSQLKPKEIVWIADGKEISIEEAQKGIPIPNKLMLAVKINFNEIKKNESE